jgi:hypothetical protein
LGETWNPKLLPSRPAAPCLPWQKRPAGKGAEQQDVAGRDQAEVAEQEG